jgi:tripeptide aminopeptidase
MKIAVKGRAAHAGVEPENGRSAIMCAARAIAPLRLGRLDETTTSNVGLISGGDAVNVVPEDAVVESELRSFSEERLDTERDLVIKSFERAAEDTGCELDIQVERSFRQFKLDPSSTPVIFLGAALKECGFEPKLNASGGGSDANIFNRHGVPTSVMNIGLVNAHSKEEYILKEDLHGIARSITALAFIAANEGKGTVA